MKPRRKPRFCRQCGKPLRTSKTGRWFFCEPSPAPAKSCQETFAEEHEPDVDPSFLLSMDLPDEEYHQLVSEERERTSKSPKMVHPDCADCQKDCKVRVFATNRDNPGHLACAPAGRASHA